MVRTTAKGSQTDQEYKRQKEFDSRCANCRAIVHEIRGYRVTVALAMFYGKASLPFSPLNWETMAQI